MSREWSPIGKAAHAGYNKLAVEYIKPYLQKQMPNDPQAVEFMLAMLESSHDLVIDVMSKGGKVPSKGDVGMWILNPTSATQPQALR